MANELSPVGTLQIVVRTRGADGVLRTETFWTTAIQWKMQIGDRSRSTVTTMIDTAADWSLEQEKLKTHAARPKGKLP